MTDQAIVALVWGIVGIAIAALVLVVGNFIYQTIKRDRQEQREHERRMRGRRRA